MLDQGSQPSDLNFSMDMSLSWWDVVVSKENCFANLLKLRSLFSLVSGSHEKCLRHESLGTNAITIKWYYNRRFLKFLCQNCFSYNRPSPASFHIILVLYKQLTEKTVNFSWIWTRILWIEGMQDHHLTTNTSPYIKTYI